MWVSVHVPAPWGVSSARLSQARRTFASCLRNVAVTPPYFHDGSAATLSRAVQEMGHAQFDRKLDWTIVTKATVAFLNTLV